MREVPLYVEYLLYLNASAAVIFDLGMPARERVLVHLYPKERIFIELATSDRRLEAS